MLDLRRREFITLLGGTVLEGSPADFSKLIAWPRGPGRHTRSKAPRGDPRIIWVPSRRGWRLLPRFDEDAAVRFQDQLAALDLQMRGNPYEPSQWQNWRRLAASGSRFLGCISYSIRQAPQ